MDTEITKEDIQIASFLKGIETSLREQVRLLGDNKGANALPHNREYLWHTTHVHRHRKYNSEMVERKAIVVEYISIWEMVADILTKALPWE